MVRFAALFLILCIAGCVAIPTEDEAAGYTMSTVQDAIRFYNRNGMDAAIEYYSSEDSRHGQWYVFIVDGDGYVIATPNTDLIGRDPALRVDATGYFYGDDLMSATESGKWISYVFPHPETGENARKHTWVVRHEGLLFASGFYEEE